MFGNLFKRKVKERKVIEEHDISIKKSELIRKLASLNINKFDLSGLGDNAIITGYMIDLTDPENPNLNLEYTSTNFTA